jgi:hypothetical protein
VNAAIYRYEVPVDDRWHTVQLSGEILHVASRDPRAVEIWAWSTDGPSAMRTFRVFGTGQPVLDETRHVGTAIPPGGQLVWHLLEAA